MVKASMTIPASSALANEPNASSTPIPASPRALLIRAWVSRSIRGASRITERRNREAVDLGPVHEAVQLRLLSNVDDVRLIEKSVPLI
jgi:hypothetical protein